MLSRIIALVVIGIGFPCLLSAQAVPTATRSLAFEVGGGFSFSNPDYTDKDLKGVSFFAGADFGAHFGIEANFHDLQIITPEDIGESSYLLGVRYKLNKRNFHPYVRVSAGISTFTFDQGNYPATTSRHYSTYAFGGGLDYRVKPKITIRVLDFEYQDWTTFSPHNLTPYVVTIGAAYNF